MKSVPSLIIVIQPNKLYDCNTINVANKNTLIG